MYVLHQSSLQTQHTFFKYTHTKSKLHTKASTTVIVRVYDKSIILFFNKKKPSLGAQISLTLLYSQKLCHT